MHTIFLVPSSKCPVVIQGSLWTVLRDCLEYAISALFIILYQVYVLTFLYIWIHENDKFSNAVLYTNCLQKERRSNYQHLEKEWGGKLLAFLGLNFKVLGTMMITCNSTLFTFTKLNWVCEGTVCLYAIILNNPFSYDKPSRNNSVLGWPPDSEPFKPLTSTSANRTTH